MLRRFLEFTGLVSPPPPPKRRPSGRSVKPAPRPQVAPQRPEVTPVRPVSQPVRPAPPPIPDRPRAEIGLPTFAQAVRTWIRQWGKHGTIPRADAVALAERRLGLDLSAYLTALHLVDGQVTKYVLPESRIEDINASVGLAKQLNLAVYGDLDTWTEAEKIDVKRRKQAEWAGRPIPPALHVPEAVQAALVKRMQERAAALVKGGRREGSSGGGVKPTPAEDLAVQALAELADEPAHTRSALPGGSKKDDDEKPEETATGKPLHEPPPAIEDGEPEAEGGGLSPPRI